MFSWVLLGTVSGCVIGEGQGWVTGSLWIEECEDGDPLLRENDFDLSVDFFAGEPLEDRSRPEELRRNSLTIRLQNTSNNLEEADGLFFQLPDVGAIAQRMTQGQPVPVTTNHLCDDDCTVADDLLRARLYLFSKCPDCREPLVGTGRAVPPVAPEGAGGEACQVPPAQEVQDGCQGISAEDLQELEALCQQRFDDPAHDAAVERILAGRSCVFFCRLGEAEAGQPQEDLAGFTVDYNDVVSGVFALNIVDARAVQHAQCPSALGRVRGMFEFEVERGRAAQSFP